MLAERSVGVVQDDLAFARMLDDGGFAVVADRSLGHASEELAHTHVAAQPGALLHVERLLEIRFLVERQDAYEQVYLRRLSGRRVDRALSKRRPRPAHLARRPGFVLDALGEAVGDDVGAVPLAELRAPHGDIASASALGFVLVVKQAQVDAENTLSRLCLSRQNRL